MIPVLNFDGSVNLSLRSIKKKFEIDKDKNLTARLRESETVSWITVRL